MYEKDRFFDSYLTLTCQSLLRVKFLKFCPLNSIIKAFFKYKLYANTWKKSRLFCEKKYKTGLKKIYKYIKSASSTISVYLKTTQLENRPPGFIYSYIYIGICPKKVTGPKRMRSKVTNVCYLPIYLFAFGAFLWPTHKAVPIKIRGGAGARKRFTTLLFKNIFSSFKAEDKNIYVSCTSAVSFFSFLVRISYGSFKGKKTQK